MPQQVRTRGWLLAALAVPFALAWTFWTPYPVTWDAAEYSWAIAQDHLPHSPYLAYWLIGQGLEYMLDAPVALALISLVAGMTMLTLFYFLQLHLLPSDWHWKKLTAACGSLLLGISGIFLINATMIEVYALAGALLFASLLLALRDRWLWGGIVWGLAVATHTMTLVTLPAILVLFFDHNEKDNLFFGPPELQQ